MAETTAISWTDHTFNPWIGCTKVSPGCANCYAATQDKLRSWTPEGWGKGKPRKRTSEANWKLPLKWNNLAVHCGECPSCGYRGHAPDGCGKCGVDLLPARQRVFCASLADWLDDEVPVEWLADLLDLIRITPNLDWLLLSKRPENFFPRMVDATLWLAHNGKEWTMAQDWHVCNKPPTNVWIGTTVEDQQRADERIPALLEIPAKIRFLSCEPLLGPVDLRGPGLYAGESIVPAALIDHQPRINWVICGGESGPGFRPFNPAWARSLRDQCKAASVAFHMKQMGGMRPSTMPPIPDDLMIREYPKP